MNNEPVAWMYESKNVDGKPYISDVSLKPLFGLVTRYGYKEIPLYTHPVKELTDEEIKLINEVVGGYVCTLKMEIDQEKQAFKGYEHCSNLPALRSELKDAEQALAILLKAQEK